MTRTLSTVVALLVGCGDNRARGEDSGGSRCAAPADPGPTYACEPQVTTVARDLGFYTSGAALGDLDGDGNLDAVLNQTDQISIVWGVGQEQIVETRTNLQAVSRVVAIGDLTNDGIDDVVMAASNDRAYVLAGATDRSLTALPEFHWLPSDGVTLLDANGDGALDLVATLRSQYRNGVVETGLNDGSGTFSEPVISVSGHYVGMFGRIAAGDVDCDGNVDLAALALSLGPNAPGLEILLGDGSGYFTTHRWYEGGASAVFLADVDANGSLDLVTQDGLITVGVRRGVGDGTFVGHEQYGVAHIGAMTVGDVTGDAKPEIVTASLVEIGASHAGGYVHVMENVGGTFKDPSQPYGEMRFWRHVTVGDIDADGRGDIVAADEAGFVSALRQACAPNDHD